LKQNNYENIPTNFIVRADFRHNGRPGIQAIQSWNRTGLRGSFEDWRWRGGGLLFFIEPAYRVTNSILIGLRLESAIIARGIKGVGDDDVSGNASSNASYTLNTQYYFNDNYVRPFVGAGLGFFSLAAVEFNTAIDNSIDNNEVATDTRFGFYPRVGLDVGHFNFTIDYNFIPKTDIPGIDRKSVV